MLVDAATFAAVACAALALRVRRARTRPRRPSAPRARDGIASLFRDRVLSLAMLVAFGSLLFMSAVWVGELFFVEDVLGRGDSPTGCCCRSGPPGWRWARCVSRAGGRGRARRHRRLAAVAVQGAGLALPARGSASSSSWPACSWAAWRTG